jgi:hypothetical protein
VIASALGLGWSPFSKGCEVFRGLGAASGDGERLSTSSLALSKTR